MKIRYEQNGEQIAEFTELTYLSDEKKFVLKSHDSEPIEYCSLLDLDDEYNPDNFSVELLNNPKSTENSIFTVEVKTENKWKRIGWIFPIQALLSREHTQAENKYFLKYAYIATYLLLHGINTIIKINETELSQELSFETLYDPNTNVLILDHDNCNAINNFDLNNYIIGLYRYGYSWTGKVQEVLLLPESTDKKPGRLKLRRISSSIDHYEIINLIFKERLPCEMPDILRFYYLYQIIEMLIQEVFDNEFRQLISTIELDTENLFDVREDMNGILGEKNRVKKLFNKYTKESDGTSRNELNEECKMFLHHVGRKIESDVPGNIYAVRCLLVHKMYSINAINSKDKDDIRIMINNINTTLTAVIQDLLISFIK